MTSSSFIGLVNNAALLLALGLIYDLLDFRQHGENSLSQQLVSGLILGAIGVAIMLNPWAFGHGIVFDTRSILLCISGFFFGFIPLSLVVIVTGTFRLIIGGTGMWIGLAVIISSGGIGLAWQYFLRNKARHPKTSELYLLGIVVHVVMLVWMLFLPWETAKNVLATITIPVMLIYPMGTAALGKLLVSREKRRESENRLQKSEEKFRCLFQYHIAAQLILDPDTGQIVDANKAAENFYGWSVAELQCKCAQEINTLPPEQVALRMKKAKSLKRFHSEFKHRLADGSIRDVEVYSSSIEIEGRQLLHSIIHDISDRQKAEEALRASEDRFRKMIEDAPDPIFIQTQMHFSYLNKKALNLFGAKDAQELIGSPVMERFHPDYHESVKQRIKGLNEHCKPAELMEQKYLRMDGSTVLVEVTAQPIMYEDNDGALVFVRDVTERKNLEAQLMQAQKMESVGRLAGGIAHDYNNMLSIILGYTDFAFEKIDTKHPLFSDLEQIHTAAERSVDITRQLLAFSRKQTIEPTLLDLNESVEGMLKMLRRLIGEDIDIVWHPGEHLWPVFMDPSQLNQMIVNLCVNARDAIKNVGKITIETSTKSFDDEYCAEHVGFRPGDYIMVAVSDDGCGMDKDLQSHIFEPFFTTKEMGKGTGLGLSTVYGIVKQNNGFINVYSEPGQGSSFRIYIPRPEALLKKLEKKKPTLPYAGGDETILLVEDDQAILKMTKMMLERVGYSVLSASKPEEAIEIANKYSGQIHLFITDVVMPEMNGRDLSKNILSIYPNLKTLFMSGYTANVIAHHGVLDEGVNFIQKPFSREQISVKVRELLDGD
ncbi:PAS domain S-box protein [Desulfobacter sp. UBA2225]|uniref:PAS domain S-box protein n=1 Tax=Desulfobacter sp. UBA2225 TaxID=1961413 RepID=UPI00257FB159|nr:PAS domain S-box protein [Desulfobacter sp. UBA2225]